MTRDNEIKSGGASTGEEDSASGGDSLYTRVRKVVPGWVGIGLFIYASIYTLSYGRTFLVPIVLAFLLSLVFGPIRRFFDRRGVPQWITALGLVLGLVVGLFALMGAMALPIIGWVERAPQIMFAVREQLADLSSVFSGVFEARDRLVELTRTDSPEVQQVEVQGTGYATKIAQLAPGFFTQMVFTLVLLFFLLASGDMFYEKIVHVMPTFKEKRRAIQGAHDVERKLSRYFLTITIINMGLGAVVGAAMWLYGMPSPVLFGLVAFIFNFVPYLGALVGLVIATAVALVSFEWIGWAPIIAATYFAATTLEGQVVTPYFVGRSLRLNTVVVFLAVSFWAWLWSAVGMIVAVPLLVTLRTVCAYVDDLNGLGEFLSERHSERKDETEEEEA